MKTNMQAYKMVPGTCVSIFLSPTLCGKRYRDRVPGVVFRYTVQGGSFCGVRSGVPTTACAGLGQSRVGRRGPSPYSSASPRPSWLRQREGIARKHEMDGVHVGSIRKHGLAAQQCYLDALCSFVAVPGRDGRIHDLQCFSLLKHLPCLYESQQRKLSINSPLYGQ